MSAALHPPSEPIGVRDLQRLRTVFAVVALAVLAFVGWSMWTSLADLGSDEPVALVDSVEP